VRKKKKEERRRATAATTTKKNPTLKKKKKKGHTHFFVLALYTTLGLSRMLVFGCKSGISLTAASASLGDRCHETKSRDQ